MTRRYPVFVGIGIGGLAVALILFGCVRCLCFRVRRKKSAKYSDKPFDLAPYKGYETAPNPPAYEPPKSAHLNRSQTSRTKNDVLPPMPSSEAANQKQLPNQPSEDVELGKLEPALSPDFSVVGTKALSDRQNPFEEPSRPLNPLDSKPHPSIPHEAPPPSQNPFDSSEYQEHKPQSPLSPYRSYSPYPSPINTRYTPSPFTEPPESRQPSPFLPAAHARVSYASPQLPYAPYSPSTSMSRDGQSNDLKSPYRAYSPALSARSLHDHISIQDSLNPFHEPSSINHEPIELSTPYTTRPQSMALDEEPRRQKALDHQQTLLKLQRTAQDPSIAHQPQQSPIISQMPGAWFEHRKDSQSPPPPTSPRTHQHQRNLPIDTSPQEGENKF